MKVILSKVLREEIGLESGEDGTSYIATLRISGEVDQVVRLRKLRVFDTYGTLYSLKEFFPCVLNLFYRSLKKQRLSGRCIIVMDGGEYGEID